MVFILPPDPELIGLNKYNFHINYREINAKESIMGIFFQVQLKRGL